MKANLAGAAIALVAFAILSLHDSLVKALGAHYTSIQIGFFSALFGFPIVSAALLGSGNLSGLRPRRPWWVLLRSLCMVVTSVTAFYAFSVLPIAQTYALLFVAPLLISVLAVPLLGESIGWRRRTAVVAGLGGVLFVLRPGWVDLSLGHIAALVSATAVSLSAITVRKLGSSERPIVLILFPMLANMAALGLALPFTFQKMPVEHVLMLCTVSALGVTGSFLIVAAYRRSETIIVATMQYSQMIWAIILGYTVFAERVDIYTLVGSIVIILSGGYVVIRERERAATKRTRY